MQLQIYTETINTIIQAAFINMTFFFFVLILIKPCHAE